MGQTPERPDVVIVGGGPVGATLALALAQGGGAAPSVMVLEARSRFEDLADGRTLALSHGSRLILEGLGVWAQLGETTPITRIHVSQRGAFGRTLLTAEEAGLPALGYVLDYARLSRALHEALKQAPLDYHTGAEARDLVPDATAPRVTWSRGDETRTTACRLLVVADGGRSLKALPVRLFQHDYGQCAVVCQVGTERPHEGLAFERFTPEGPLALLPYRDHYALVWTASPKKAALIREWDEATFLARLHTHFGDRRGRFLWAGPRASFPLTLRLAFPRTAARTVLIGNAAQTLHPVAGQGFNMGLRDAWELASHILATPRGELGGPAMLRAYATGRRPDTAGGILFTDFLVRGFSNALPVLSQMRAAALSVLDVLPPAKDFVVRRMIFGARG